MATTQNNYTGNGSNKLFSITFPYLDTADIDVFLNGTLQTVTTQYTFANATTIEFVAAPANGAAVRIDRSTDDSALAATFFPGSSIKAADLNADFDQTLYVVQEINNKAVKLDDPLYVNKTYIDNADALKVTKAGDSMSGVLAMGTNKITGLGNPTNAQDAATKTYVDAADALKVAKAGDSMTGPLAMGTNKVTGMGNPTNAQDATTKTYVDTADALKVAKAGDTMSGNLAMGGNKVTGLGIPSASADAVTKSYVDGYINTTYLGPLASDPATRPGGAALQTGDQYFNTTQNIVKAWTGTVWVISAAAGNIVRWRKTASAGNTTLSGVDDLGVTLSYVVGNEQVYLNGALQTRGVDYTAGTGTSITLTPALLAGDVVELHAVQGYVSATITPGSINDALVAPAAGIQYSKLALSNSIVNADVNASAGITAGKLSFTQAGTGATARTIDSKLKDAVSVKDFGAVGDGTTNDAASIQATIDAVYAAGGGTVGIPEGIYYIGTTSIYCRYANISIVGSGGASVLKTSAAMTTPALYWGDGSTVPRPQNSVLMGIAIDGNSSSNVNAHGIYCWSSLATIRDCFVRNCGGAGMYFYQSWSMWVEFNQIYGCNPGAYIGQECNNFTFFSNEVNWAAGHGIVLNGGHGVRIQNNGVEECQRYGLYVLGNAASAIREVVYEGNYHERNGKNASYPYEIYADKSGSEISGLRIRNNYLTNNQSPTRDINIVNVNSILIENNTLTGLNLRPGYIPSPTIGQEINDTSLSDNASYASHVLLTPTAGPIFFGRLGSLTVASQEGAPGTRGTLFQVRGRYLASPYPTITYGNNEHYFGTAAPGSGTYKRGDIVWNTSPSASGFIGWTCVTAGTPGTWKTFGAISA
jgi:hypothetical protein